KAPENGPWLHSVWRERTSSACSVQEAHIQSIARTEFGRDRDGRVLLLRFLNEEGYSRTFAEHLIEVAAGRRGASWEVRRAAFSLLENNLLGWPEDDERECAGLPGKLGVDSRLPPVVELRRRMARLARVHRAIHGRSTSVSALGDFLHVARHECKL